MFPTFHLATETDSVYLTSVFCSKYYYTMDEVKKSSNVICKMLPSESFRINKTFNYSMNREFSGSHSGEYGDESLLARKTL
jgi:hypothetical protein